MKHPSNTYSKGNDDDDGSLQNAASTDAMRMHFSLFLSNSSLFLPHQQIYHR